MSFNFKDECKKRYNERVDEYLSKYPKEMDNYEGCVYFIGELSPIRVSESKASIMLDFIDRLEDKRNYKHLDLFLEQYRHDKKYEENEIIFKEFDQANDFFIILKGEVGIYKFDKD